MKTLKEIQNKFIDGAYGEGKLAVLLSIKDGKAPKEELLDIYRNNLYATLTNALRLTYPKIHQLVGEKKFKKFCHEFIKQNRSYSGNLDEYGENFSDFFVKKADGFLSELARFEWFKHKSYLAKDMPIFNIEELQKLSQEKLFDVKFKLHPSCFLIDSSYNLLGKKKQNQPNKRLNYFVIYRHDFEVKTEKISKSEFSFLSGVKENLSLYQIYEKHEINIQAVLQKYLANSVLSDFSVY